MKSQKDIQKVLDEIVAYDKSKYPGQTYEQGIEYALQWVVGEVSDKDFVGDYNKVEDEE